jgi:hypothetical protein
MVILHWKNELKIAIWANFATIHDIPVPILCQFICNLYSTLLSPGNDFGADCPSSKSFEKKLVM